MTALPQHATYMTEQAYLQFERRSDIKHEYVDGEIYVKAGAT